MSAVTAVSRRSFLLGSTAALAGCATPSAPSVPGRAPGARLVFGVVSDIHVTDWASAEIFRKTLRHFRDRGADAVMIAGDMADHGILPQLENVAKSWYEVFPNDIGRDGRRVEKLFIFGNHDAEGLAYRDEYMDRAFSVHGMTHEEAKALTLKKLGYAACWEKCFHEKFEPIYRKDVGGYAFVGAHWDTWHGVRGLEAWFDAHGRDLPRDRPFFFFQHQTPRGTLYGADSWGDDDGQSVRALAPYPNAVAFSGHDHFTLVDGRNYWCGEFTSIGTASLSYACLPEKGRSNVPDYRANLDAREGQLVTVFDDRLEIERRDFWRDEDLDGKVVIATPTRASSFTVRGLARSAMPRFPAGAKVVLAQGADGLTVTIPGAFANPAARPFDHFVTYTFLVRDPAGKETRKNVDRNYYHPAALMARKRAAETPVVFTLPAAEIPQGAVRVKVRVVPRNSYGFTGEDALDAELALA